MNLPSCDHSGKATAPESSLVHRSRAMSKTFMAIVSRVMAAIDRPSGDQRGTSKPSDAGRTATFPVAMSRMRKSDLELAPTFGEVEKTIFRPSGRSEEHTSELQSLRH